MIYKFQLCIAAVMFALISSTANAQSEAAGFTSGYESVVAENGDISLPIADFRRDWTLLGAWIVNGDEDAKGIHNVYAERGVVDHYRKTGEFPDGAVLVKELLSAAAGDFTTGRISLANSIEGWFVMVKDTKERFPRSALWGDGWGWAFFESKNPKRLITKNYKEECITCHIPAKDSDWIYSEAYPVLGENRGGITRLKELLEE